MLPAISRQKEPVRTAVFLAKRQLVGLVYDAARLEGSPYTLPEVQTLLDGVTVGGHRLEDERLVLNLRNAWQFLFNQVLAGKFVLDKATFCQINGLIAFEDALEWGVFRSRPVRIQGVTNYHPPEPDQLDTIFERGISVLSGLTNPYHQAFNFFLFGALHQFFFDGNKRTARLVSNGLLLSSGQEALNIPATRQLEFNQKMVRFYDTREADEMGDFLTSCVAGD